ncbi:Bacteriophage HK97-gp10, putative tail-component [Schinkia azotoformans MEV2011]|uniref:Bacteriophage HK97-gp10, putative tail-component n=1 Tax=Schinkia azotoformans MEV2011 TaxID=1348973 RepID=A0A072NU54_SCHAZ|nr:HK97 gp10 family phage protein [Schinkia azotoformans]KEF40413.1 Bacteriophage HK97-gp10, putative tail-component [Schinkia azotoformans MEV2011]MEC1696176.1 HK97 gp10 family phage protein [Schinkia azotoformans]MEC1725321.1 HK97 gp10 family phage protein [Schinkia azotoformans]MEC1779432.1 HK97 gp10 family phage protein [Schinkia azotoformans]MED4330083.1 HK97 gp10 family phage protein [Schinkia azotoformans]
MGFEYSEMKAFRRQIADLRKASYDIHMKVAKRIALLAIRKVKKMTPVDTGDLRNSWEFTVIKKGDDYIVTIFNLKEYASFVENGHRIVVAGKTVGWVEGRFMLKLTVDEMERIAPNMWKKEVEKEMRRIFGN